MLPPFLYFVKHAPPLRVLESGAASLFRSHIISHDLHLVMFFFSLFQTILTFIPRFPFSLLTCAFNTFLSSTNTPPLPIFEYCLSFIYLSDPFFSVRQFFFHSIDLRLLPKPYPASSSVVYRFLLPSAILELHLFLFIFCSFLGCYFLVV